MTIIVVTSLFLLLIILYFVAFRRKQTVKLTSDEYSLLMRRKFDIYDLRSFLVRGDFNTTFEAFDPDRKAMVALRVLDHNKIYHDQIVQQFNLKGEMLKFLAERYPGDKFVQGIKFGTVKIEEEPRPYIVSDYIQGASLYDILERYGRLNAKDSLDIIRQLGESFSLAHSQRIWVREIAPQNALLTLNPAGKLVVTLANVGVPFKSLPSEYSAELKKGYYSPEDRRDDLVDERSDVYALAALLFRMLQGYDPSAREAGEEWNDLTTTLAPSLSDEPHLRPPTIDSFLKTLLPLQNIKSPAPGIPWEKEIPRIVAKRAKMKIKRTDAEVIEQAPGRRRAFVPMTKQTKDRFIISFLTGLFMTFFMWIGKKVENLLASPKKFVLGIGILIVGVFVGLWYFVYSPERGSIVVKVDALSNQTPAEAVKEGTVTVEVRDEKTGALAPVRFSSDYADSVGEGRIVLRTSKRGKVLLGYKGHFDRQSTIVVLTAKKAGEFMEDRITKKMAAEDIVAAFHLRPERNGAINIRVTDTKKLLRPGIVPPESYSIEVMATTSSGAPLTTMQFRYDNQPLPQAGPGKVQTSEQKFVLESTHELRYQVEDSAIVSINVKGSQNPILEFESTPSRWKIVQSSGNSLSAVVSIRKRSSTEKESFLFQVYDEDGSPAEGLEVFLNGQSIGTTSAQGKIEYAVFDVEGFWAQQPKVTVDLHKYNTKWSMSKEFQLQRRENVREFPIKIADIRPDN